LTATLPLDSSARRSWAGDDLAPLGAAALAVLAFAQPVLSAIAAAPAFLVAHRAGPDDIALLLGVVCGIVPALAALLVFVLRSVGVAAARSLPAIVLGLLVTLATLPVLDRVPVPGTWLAAPVVGAVVGWALRRPSTGRWLSLALSPALLAVPLAFALDPGVRRATASAAAPSLEPVEVRTPVVVVVLDEWTFGSLLDPGWVVARGTPDVLPTSAGDWQGALDQKRLPRLARFARSATWYANARASADVTDLALPALLTGRLPSVESLPRLADHPDSLFTRLGGGYRVTALESVTALCPPGVNRLNEEAQLGPSDGELLLADAAVVWLHAVAPPDLELLLPPIDQSWSGFLGAEQEQVDESAAPDLRERERGLWKPLGADRVELFRRFVEAIEPGDRQLYFAHGMLPHVPFEYLPDGARYLSPSARMPGLVDERWVDDQRLADQALQRYLLQVSFADRLLGELFDRLEAAGLLDTAVVVVTSDHGASFRAGAARRMLEDANASEIVPVPLFFKRPGQRTGEISLEQVTALDVLPMVLESVGLAVADGSLGPGVQRVAAGLGPGRVLPSASLPQQLDSWPSSEARWCSRARTTRPAAGSPPLDTKPSSWQPRTTTLSG
jgi:hypothetical protein